MHANSEQADGNSSLSISSGSGEYQVIIGAGLLDEVLAESTSVVIADQFFSERLANFDPILVAAYEEGKTLVEVERLATELRSRGLTRGGSIIAVGGGIVQDLATLVSSLYQRGVVWEYVPSTLLAMADSCIGGKSSINAGDTKNLLGNIYPPRRVVIDPSLLTTLSDSEISGGLCEAIKISYCRGTNEFHHYLDIVDEFESSDSKDNLKTYIRLLTCVLDYKRWFIEIDEFDRKERRQLNFGHTFGHALEVASRYEIQHGLAVGFGMLAAIHMVSEDRELSGVELELQEQVCRLLQSLDLQFEIDWAYFEQAFESDKKHTNDHYALILPQFGGGVEVNFLPRTEEVREKVRRATGFAMSTDSQSQ
jgi:3-dehydroquinate synthase